MLWIGILFTLIMLADWFMQKNEGVKLRTRITVLLVSIGFFLISEVVFKLKDRWNLPVLFRYLSETMLGRLF
ncbi:MAG: hypothetical protein KZY74_01860 [Paenibacillaceae bacterium]|uniref:Uncharacterized protein n=1 Tax=Paenibacillus mellifer TaxID=2937794 RepID=A0A9X1XYB9_9BACL|nr:hypothetical protein [Paenibacillus mellifer]MBW4838115.1 hypothetical protein [Paenibacillaceae bacterium]MCK8486961.1 hypothetical protein [Paenibacillus mellifer]